MSATSMLDVVGILESAGEFATITLKNGRETDKRSIVLRDHSNKSIEVTLWGGFASNPGQQLQQVQNSRCTQRCAAWFYQAVVSLQVRIALLT